jgi:hypothetical protein
VGGVLLIYHTLSGREPVDNLWIKASARTLVRFVSRRAVMRSNALGVVLCVSRQAT